LRETLFDVLTAGNPAALANSGWLDLFAGTGAVGIEALSRGAAMVYFVESSETAAGLIQKNLLLLEVAARAQILRQPVHRALVDLASQSIRPDYVFLDPPYALKDVFRQTLVALANSSLSENALLIAEHEKKFDPGEKFGILHRVRRLIQGDAALSFYRRILSNEQPMAESKVL
jgi:16S rRNA (guanine966-N2)-methyltransferase